MNLSTFKSIDLRINLPSPTARCLYLQSAQAWVNYVIYKKSSNTISNTLKEIIHFLGSRYYYCSLLDTTYDCWHNSCTPVVKKMSSWELYSVELYRQPQFMAGLAQLQYPFPCIFCFLLSPNYNIAGDCV